MGLIRRICCCGEAVTDKASEVVVPEDKEISDGTKPLSLTKDELKEQVKAFIKEASGGMHILTDSFPSAAGEAINCVLVLDKSMRNFSLTPVDSTISDILSVNLIDSTPMKSSRPNMPYALTVNDTNIGLPDASTQHRVWATLHVLVALSQKAKIRKGSD